MQADNILRELPVLLNELAPMHAAARSLHADSPSLVRSLDALQPQVTALRDCVREICDYNPDKQHFAAAEKLWWSGLCAQGVHRTPDHGLHCLQRGAERRYEHIMHAHVYDIMVQHGSLFSSWFLEAMHKHVKRAMHRNCTRGGGGKHGQKGFLVWEMQVLRLLSHRTACVVALAMASLAAQA